MTKKKNLNNQLSFSYCLIIFSLKFKLDINKNIYLSFSDLYFLLPKLLFIFLLLHVQ